ncbi:helix-turn-helix domain-containing protein [Paenibacillus hodogayensis]|uniref:Helix-turn-helix domain-containing protein n=1 Tax=Paenibacillus hodogayensis TaxID=279208 RepID=A0ABV5W255_9BACL
MSRHHSEHPLYLLSSIRLRKLPFAPAAKSRNIPFHALCFPIKGEGTLLIDGEVYKLAPFELFYFSPGMNVTVCSPHEPIEYYVVLFAPMIVKQAGGKLSIEAASTLPHPLPQGRIPIRSAVQMLHAFRNLEAAAQSEPFASRLELERLIDALTRQSPAGDRTLDERIEASIGHMTKHMASKLSLGQLAAASRLAPSAYSRLFKKNTGMLPIEYLTDLRIEEAKKLLMQPDSRVKEVSASVGFCNEFYFSRTFQRITGVSPTLYMKRGRLRIAVASSMNFRDNLNSMGVEPVAAADLYQYPWMDDEAHRLLCRQQLQRLAEERPDLIIGDHYHQEYRDDLKRIGPTVILDRSDWNWRLIHLKIAELASREREAEHEIARLEVRAHEMRGKLRRLYGDDRVTVMQVNHRLVGIQGSGNHPLNELLFTELGLRNGTLAPADSWRMEIEPELLPHFETDHIFIQKHHLLAGSERIADRLQKTVSWNTNDAVRNNKVRWIPNWFVMSWTPNGRNQIIDSLPAMT